MSNFNGAPLFQDLPPSYASVMANNANDEKIDDDAIPKQHESKIQMYGHGDYITIKIHSPDPEQILKAPGFYVICIDVSGSMNDAITCTDENGKKIDDGFSILDIVKHASKAIISGLNPNDYVAIVTFSGRAQIHLPMQIMNLAGKTIASDTIDKLIPTHETNLWVGIETSLDVLRLSMAKLYYAAPCNGNIILLTDGIPTLEYKQRNDFDTAIKAYFKKYNDFTCALNMIGFGSKMDSELLDRLTRLVNGDYCFVPDGGFIGTIFVNLAANNALNTHQQTVLNIGMSDASIQQVLANTETNISDCYDNCDQSKQQLNIPIGNIKIGQSRYIVIPRVPIESVQLRSYNTLTGHIDRLLVNNSGDMIEIAQSNDPIAIMEMSVQLCRQMFVSSIRKCMFFTRNGNWIRAKNNVDEELASLHCKINSLRYQNIRKPIYCAEILAKLKNLDDQIQGILQDLTGQVVEAFSREDWYNTWGRHFLPSLVRAHITQQCNNFKDPGVQYFGGKAFNSLRSSLEKIFKTMGDPKPSRHATKELARATPVSGSTASAYYNAGSGCFHSESIVKMADGTVKHISDIIKGDKLQPIQQLCSNENIDSYEVLTVVRTKVQQMIPLVSFGQGVSATLTHPVFIDNEWTRPDIVANTFRSKQSDIVQNDVWCEYVYNLVLDKGHIVTFSSFSNGKPCDYHFATLGHGFTGNYYIEHSFFGTDAVITSLSKMQGYDTGIVTLGVDPFIRDPITGWITGFNH